MNKKQNDPKSLLMLVTSMLIFGSIGIFRRYIPLPSAFLAFARGILGGLFILVYRKLSIRESGEKLPGKYYRLLVFTGAVIGLNWILLFEAYSYTTVPIATLCYYMAPTIVILLSPIVFKESLTRKKTICAITAVIGMVLVSGVTAGGSFSGNHIRGILLGLGAAVLYAAVVILNKKCGGMDAYRKTTIQLLSAGTVMVPYLLLSGGLETLEFSLRTVVLLLIVGIVHTGIAYLLYFGSIDGLRAQTVAIISYVDPVSALLFSALFLNEPLNAMGIFGAVLIIGSAIISELPEGTSK